MNDILATSVTSEIEPTQALVALGIAGVCLRGFCSQNYKALIAALLMPVMMSTTACGLKAGSFVAGSTSYLREANRGLQIESSLESGLSMHEHTDEDKRRLANVLRGVK